MSEEFKMGSEEVKRLQDRINTYLAKENPDNYRPDTVLDDILYFVAVSIDSEKYEFAQGYRKFGEFLTNHFKANQ